ncbi:hypothetical protein BISA_1940 [Bifidobacterium saguini DSM 23967]|uniref:Uncharacterized protein n=2 Tax=Bifidobacterium saguini TaxID=762210 RepID=A0A087D611_9BIFI|nr:hypothetical protein [Bifidobacterium saguini]KFI90961.1 hypothetical protein BISA_1940 [Bifidobacterium saguini DSM 23967]QTB91453.1 hypothetical protein BSD967_03250 [Bifidobacterium saguini]
MGVDVMASLAFAGISAGAAVGAAIAAVIGNKKAQGANDIAAQALGKSDKANELSERANQIAQDALEVSRSQHLRETTHEVVDWTLEIDDAGVFTLSNIGTDSACNVAVVITGVPEEGCESAEWRLNESRRIQHDIPAGRQIIIDTPQIRDVVEQARTTFLYIPGVYDHRAHMDIEVTIYWENSVGVLSSKVIKRHFD